MYFRYGGYRHDSGEVSISSISGGTEFSPRGQPKIFRKQWQLSGVLLADTTAELTAKIRNLEAAYERQGQNAGLFEANGTPTAHYLSTAGAIGGVRSLGVMFPQGGPTEYVLQRAYTVTLEADYPFVATSPLEFTETLSFQGTCGPIWRYLTPINGSPERQIVQQRSTQRATQSGSAMGFRARPPPPPPLFPKNEHEEQRVIGLAAPRWMNGTTIDFGVSWSYSFESDTPMNGTPRTS